MSVTLRLIHELTANSAQNLDLLTNVDWIIVPVANPDGHAFSHSTVSLKFTRIFFKSNYVLLRTDYGVKQDRQLLDLLA